VLGEHHSICGSHATQLCVHHQGARYNGSNLLHANILEQGIEGSVVVWVGAWDWFCNSLECHRIQAGHLLQEGCAELPDSSQHRVHRLPVFRVAAP
jgi:hypothetical protein